MPDGVTQRDPVDVEQLLSQGKKKRASRRRAEAQRAADGDAVEAEGGEQEEDAEQERGPWCFEAVADNADAPGSSNHVRVSN